MIFDSIFGSNSPDEVPALLRNATAKHDSGDLEGGILLLRSAYRLMKEISTGYPVETFLRLPLYLQKAGRFEEAWRELSLLLNEGYPNQMNAAGLRTWDHSIIHDKMRLILQRENKRKEAIIYGVKSVYLRFLALSIQKRKKEIYRDDMWVEINSLLKKANLLCLEQEIVKTCRGYLKTISEENLTLLQTELKQIIGIN